jgi:hypothetical protein
LQLQTTEQCLEFITVFITETPVTEVLLKGFPERDPASTFWLSNKFSVKVVLGDVIGRDGCGLFEEIWVEVSFGGFPGFGDFHEDGRDQGQANFWVGKCGLLAVSSG